MASATAQTEYRRKLRKKNAGTKARRARENKGTTPVFPVHTPEADANAAAKSES
ncbi:MAG: hypothetical protein Q8P41_24580 [Pseudomonadota bacterium]|nr:hypothetical protein [Pseudomonadota bacterium]